MKAVMFFGSPIKPEEFRLASYLHSNPPVFTEEQWDFNEPFTDPACSFIPVNGFERDSLHVYAGGSLHIVSTEDEALRFDPLFLHKMNSGNLMTRRLRMFCKLTGLTFDNNPYWRFALKPE